jgi:hypothetical protein
MFESYRSGRVKHGWYTNWNCNNTASYQSDIHYYYYLKCALSDITSNIRKHKVLPRRYPRFVPSVLCHGPPTVRCIINLTSKLSSIGKVSRYLYIMGSTLLNPVLKDIPEFHCIARTTRPFLCFEQSFSASQTWKG